VDADPDLPWYIVNVSRHGDFEENKRLVVSIKFQSPGSEMTPAQARQFPLLQRIFFLDVTDAAYFEAHGAFPYIYK